jgi:hypothetical protein
MCGGSIPEKDEGREEPEQQILLVPCGPHNGLNPSIFGKERRPVEYMDGLLGEWKRTTYKSRNI